MRTSLLLILIFFIHNTGAQVFEMTVAKTGDGAYRSIQAAINRIPDNSTSRYRVYIKNGEYNEKVQLFSSKDKVSLIGESTDGVIISWDDYQGRDGMSGAASYTFLAEGDDLYMENVTIRNTAGDVGQAVALRTTGDRQVFSNCRITGYQDTYYANKGRQYNHLCHIEGATDFIYGDGTAVFDSCTVYCLEGGQYITAPADTKITSRWPDNSTFYHGLLFTTCEVMAAENVADNSYYLGRPWQPNASSVYISCTLGPHIRPEGWSTWGDTDNHLSSFFAEYRSIGPEGNPIDTSSRVSWSRQLDQAEAESYYGLDYFLSKDDMAWDPLPVTLAPSPPSTLTGDGHSLEWSGVTGAVGYVVIRNDSTIGFTGDPGFEDLSADPSGNYAYVIRSVSESGALSMPSQEYTVEASGIEQPGTGKQTFDISISQDLIISAEPFNINIFTSSGRLVMKRHNICSLSLASLEHGLYVAVIGNEKGEMMTRKIIR